MKYSKIPVNKYVFPESAALLQIPVFQRGGSVVPIRTTIGKSTGWMTNSPYGLRVALSTKVYGQLVSLFVITLSLYSGSLLKI
jgi:alpha-glucosidase (family GH31 glycosyl hydrolase)